MKVGGRGGERGISPPGREEARVDRGRARVDCSLLQLPGYLSGKLSSPRRRREDSPGFSRLARSAAVSRVRTYRLPYWPEPRSRISDRRERRRRHRGLRRETGRIHRSLLLLLFSFSL